MEVEKKTEKCSLCAAFNVNVELVDGVCPWYHGLLSDPLPPVEPEEP